MGGGTGMKCPTCNGTGMEETGVVYYGSVETRTCYECNGTGEVPDESQVYGNDCIGGRCEF